MEFSDEQKQKILLAVLQERYNASHVMRERSLRFTLWLSGMALPIGWLLVTKQQLIFGQKIALALFVVAIFGGTICFLRGLRRGFEKNRQVMVQCEQALGLYEEGIYLADSSLFSQEYRSPTKKWSDHFSTISVWLLTVAVSLQLLIWMAPTPVDPAAQQKITIEHVKGEKNNGKSAQ